MISQKLIFIGRTGVGKSSLINYFSGTNKCDTDKYRPCTKESKVVNIQIDGVNYELIDTPGLGEGGAELDKLYLEFIDQYLIQDEVSPIFVFKSDDSRLRSEDYSLLQTLCRRFGDRIFKNCSLFLTFGGNLEDNYYPRVCKRVKLITNEIYKTQLSLGHKLFPGFRRVEIIDSSLMRVYDLHPWELEKNFRISPEVMIAESIQNDDFKELGKVLGIEEELCKGLLRSLVERKGENTKPQNFGEWNKIAEKFALFPFHNIIEVNACPLDMSTNKEDSGVKKVEPNSIYEVAEILIKNDINESTISIENGILSVQRTLGHKQFKDREEYANCIRVDAYCYRDDSGQFMFIARLKLTNHPYTDEGKPDEDKIIEEANNAPTICYINLDGIVDFIKIIQFPSYLLGIGEDFMRKGITDNLHDNKAWEDVTIIL